MRTILRMTSSTFFSPRAYSTKREDFLIRSLISTDPNPLKGIFEKGFKKNMNFRTVQELAAAADRITDYTELLNVRRNLQVLYIDLMSRNPRTKVDQNDLKILKKLIDVIKVKLNLRLNERVEFYLKQFKPLSEEKLKAVITQTKKALQEGAENFEEKAKLYAARMSLHPKFQLIAVCAEGSASNNLILARAQKDFYETVLFFLEGEEPDLPASLFDHIIFVSSLLNLGECTKKLKDFLLERGVSNYHAAIDPGLPVMDFDFPSQELSALCQIHSFGNPNSQISYVGPSPVDIEMLSDKWFSTNLAQSLGVPVRPGYYGENQDPDSLIQVARDLGLGEIPLLFCSRDFSAEVSTIEEAQRFIRNVQSTSSAPKMIIQTSSEYDSRVGVQVLCGTDGAFYFGMHRQMKDKTVEGIKDDEIKKMALKIAQAPCNSEYRGFMTIEFLSAGEQKYFYRIIPGLTLDYGMSALSIGELSLIDASHWVAAGYPVKGFLQKFFEDRNQNTFGKSSQEMLIGAELLARSKQNLSASLSVAFSASLWKQQDSESVQTEATEHHESITYGHD